MMKKINWARVWDEFSDWLCELENTKACEHCGSHTGCFPDWDDQQVKIQKLVNAQVRERDMEIVFTKNKEKNRKFIENKKNK